MPYFRSSEELYTIVVPFLGDLINGPLRPRLQSVEAAVKVRYYDPDVVFYFNTATDPPLLLTGSDADARPADVELAMAADDGHRLWLGELKMQTAMVTKKITMSGSFMKMLRLLPAFEPAFAEYRHYMLSTGRDDLVASAPTW